MNTAKRLLLILDALIASKPKPGIRASDAWATAMGLGKPGDQDLDDEVTLALQAVRSELNMVMSVLSSAKVPQDLYVSQLERIRSVASPSSMHNEWRGMVGNITPPDVRLALGWAAVYMPDDEAELGAQELAGLTEEFDRLAVEVEGAGLPPAIHAYVTKQLRTLRVALRMYRVRGVTVVHEALEQAYGAARKAQPAMAAEAASAPKAKGLVDKVNGVISRALTVCDSVEKTHKGGSAMLDMAKGLQKLLEMGKDITS